MSLINDALKRVKKTHQAQSSVPPLDAPPLPPVETEKSHGGAAWFLLIIALVAVGCFLIGLAFATHKPPAETKPLMAETQVAHVPVIPVLPKPTPPPQTNVIVAPPKPAPPPLQLQGILMGSGDPQAIVNGQTVYVGDSVNGFHVQLISKNNVTFVAADGTEKTLMLSK